MIKISIKYIAIALFLIIIGIFLLKPKEDSIPTDPKQLIQKINAQNEQVNSVSCDLVGNFASFYWFYEKPNKVYFKTTSRNKDQAIISDDGQTYWFWIKTFDPRTVYYCDSSKVDNTRVKHPLKPNFIKGILFFDKMPPEAHVNQYRHTTEISFFDENYLRKILVNHNQITEQHWLENGELILSVYYNSDLVEIFWHEENQSTIARIKQLIINPKEKPDQMPLDLKKIDLNGY